MHYQASKCSKISKTSLDLFSNKMLVSLTGIQKMLVRIANREYPDLGLHCLSRPFWQTTCINFFRILNVIHIKETG